MHLSVYDSMYLSRNVSATCDINISVTNDIFNVTSIDVVTVRTTQHDSTAIICNN